MSLFSRRVRRGVIAAVGAGLLVATCATANGATAKVHPLASKQSMTLWTNATTGPGTQFFAKTIKAFDKAHPGVTIKMQVVNNTDYDGKLQTALQAGGSTAPSIFFQRGGGNMNAMVAAHQLAVFTPSKATKKLVPAGDYGYDTASNGKVYAQPVDIQPGGFYYSKDLFKQAGITGTPKTWAQLTADVAKLKAAGITPVAVGAKDQWPAAHWYYWLSLRECSQKTLLSTSKSLKFTDGCWTKAGNMLKAFNATKPFQTGFLDTPAQTGAGSSAGLVANHKAAMELSGAWDPGVIGSLTPDQKPLPDLSYFPFPSIPGGKGGAGAMMGGADAYSCSAWAPQPACNDFLNYLVSTPVAKAYSTAFESVSTNKVAQASSAASDPIVKAELTAANKAPYASLWLDTLFGSNVGNAFNTAVVNLLAGTGTVAGIVSAASDANAKG